MRLNRVGGYGTLAVEKPTRVLVSATRAAVAYDVALGELRRGCDAELLGDLCRVEVTQQSKRNRDVSVGCTVHMPILAEMQRALADGTPAD